MVAAIDWSLIPLTTGFGWLVVLVLQPFETVFQTISGLGRLPKREKEERKDRREKKMSKQPHPHILQAQ